MLDYMFWRAIFIHLKLALRAQEAKLGKLTIMDTRSSFTKILVFTPRY